MSVCGHCWHEVDDHGYDGCSRCGCLNDFGGGPPE